MKHLVWREGLPARVFDDPHAAVAYAQTYTRLHGGAGMWTFRTIGVVSDTAHAPSERGSTAALPFGGACGLAGAGTGHPQVPPPAAA